MTARRRTPAALVALLATALMSLAASAQQAAQNPRIALVIGNATYRDAALATTANDAGLIAQTLQAAGFDVVGARDLDGQSLRTAFRDFLDKASAAGPNIQVFVYLAGRGVQYDGDNYFVPVDAQINRDADVPIDALRISDFAHALAQTPGNCHINRFYWSVLAVQRSTTSCFPQHAPRPQREALQNWRAATAA